MKRDLRDWALFMINPITSVSASLGALYCYFAQAVLPVIPAVLFTPLFFGILLLPMIVFSWIFPAE
jgi:hypothetical protein